MRQFWANHLKNSLGWKSKRKLVVISIDDYGNVRLDSKEAREKMNSAGLKVLNRFDAFDTLETKLDLEMLYETLTSVKDKNGNPAIFTPFSIPCNIDFERMKEEEYSTYHYELLPVTFDKLSKTNPKAYEGTWELWNEGIKNKLMAPQFHGREHFNLKVFTEKLNNKDAELLTALQNRSNTSISKTGYATINYTAAYEFWDVSENVKLQEIIEDGLDNFKTVFGYNSTHFNPPGGREHNSLHAKLSSLGVKSLDNSFVKKEHQGLGKYTTKLCLNGSFNSNGLLQLVRNVVFEPNSDTNVDSVALAMRQIDIAFKYNATVNISSHRVNFCGHVDENNRKEGLESLQKLLKNIVAKYPDVEFVSIEELVAIILKDKGRA